MEIDNQIRSKKNQPLGVPHSQQALENLEKNMQNYATKCQTTLNKCEELIANTSRQRQINTSSLKSMFDGYENILQSMATQLRSST